MDELMTINGQDIAIKEYMGQRIVTFKDVDQVHGRPEGTARKRFNENRERFIEGTDFFRIRPGDEADSALSVFRTVGIPPMGITLLTETGYLMLVKSFTDDLAWTVQRELVRGYFRARQAEAPRSTALSKASVRETMQIISKRNIALEVLGEMYESFDVEAYRYHLGEVMQLLAFDVSNRVCDMKQVQHKRQKELSRGAQP